MNSQQTIELFKNRFDVARVHDFDDVSDAIFLMLDRAKCTLLIITDLLESTTTGHTTECSCLYSAIEELNDIENLTRLYRKSLKQPETTTPNVKTGDLKREDVTKDMVVARIHEIADMIEQDGLTTE